MAIAFDGKKGTDLLRCKQNEDFFGHFLYKFRTLVVQTYDFSWIYELQNVSIYELGL